MKLRFLEHEVLLVRDINSLDHGFFELGIQLSSLVGEKVFDPGLEHVAVILLGELRA